MNASRQLVELVGDELEQSEFVEVLALFEVPPELPEELLELLELPPELLMLCVVEVLMAIVARFGAPKSAPPATAVNAKPKLLPAAAALTGTEIVFAVVSPSAQLTVPLVAEKSVPAVAVPLTVVYSALTAPAASPVRLTITTAAVDDMGTTYVAEESATAEGPFELLAVLEVLVLEGETVDAVSLFEPPQAATEESSAQMIALRKAV